MFGSKIKWIVALFLLVGCSTTRYIPTSAVEKVVYKDSTIYLRDTVFVEVPKEIVRVIVPEDTVSVLRTTVALSEAKIDNGMLHHRLEQNGAIPVQIDTVMTVRYVDRYIEKPIIEEVIVTKKEKYIPSIFWWSLICNIIVILYLVFRLYIKMKGVA